MRPEIDEGFASDIAQYLPVEAVSKRRGHDLFKNQQDYRVNMLAFLDYWKTIPAKKVVLGLDCWQQDEMHADEKSTCDTIACAGGWLPFMPAFRAMGVRANRKRGGEPYWGRVRGYALARKLFGNDILFQSRNDCDCWHCCIEQNIDSKICQKYGRRISDHRLVELRFRYALGEEIL